jgi:hypothetical protein
MKMISGQRILALAATAVVVAALPAHAATDNELQAVRGTSGYEANVGAPFRQLFGHISLADDAIAITRPASNALLVLPDSSQVALGANTNVRVGAFNDPSATTPTTLTLQNGAVRFDVRHPSGGRANYVFQTGTSQIAVRGTIGLYSSGPNGDVVSCLACAPGDVVVTVGSQTYAIVTGQTLTVSAAGVVATVATSVATAQSFAGTGLSTDANAATAFTGSAGGAAGAAAASIHAAAAPAAPPPRSRVRTAAIRARSRFRRPP